MAMLGEEVRQKALHTPGVALARRMKLPLEHNFRFSPKISMLTPHFSAKRTSYHLVNKPFFAKLIITIKFDGTLLVATQILPRATRVRDFEI